MTIDYDNDILLCMRPMPDTNSTDNSVASVSVENGADDTIVKHHQLSSLYVRSLELESVMDELRPFVLTTADAGKMRRDLRTYTGLYRSKLKKEYKRCLAASKEYKTLQSDHHATLNEINQLTRPRWQSQSKQEQPEQMKSCVDANCDSDGQEDDQIAAFRRGFKEIPIVHFKRSIEKKLEGLATSISMGCVNNLELLDTNYPTVEHLRNDYRTYLRLMKVMARIESGDGLETAGTRVPNKPETPNPNKDKDTQDSELRRQKTLATGIARWEQLEWKLPMQDFKKLDYQREVNRRYKLANGVSKRHARVTQWCIEVNNYLRTVNSDGTNKTSLSQGFNGLNTGSKTC